MIHITAHVLPNSPDIHQLDTHHDSYDAQVYMMQQFKSMYSGVLACTPLKTFTQIKLRSEGTYAHMPFLFAEIQANS